MSRRHDDPGEELWFRVTPSSPEPYCTALSPGGDFLCTEPASHVLSEDTALHIAQAAGGTVCDMWLDGAR